MKKSTFFFQLVSVFSLVILGLVPVVSVAGNFGLDITADSACSGGACFNKSDTPESITTTVINAGLSFVFLAFMLLALFAGFRWMLARGNEEHVTTAKNTLEAAIIGLVIVSAAYAISKLVMSKLGG